MDVTLTSNPDYYIDDNEQIVTVTATEADGYRFVGWYDSSGKLVSKSKNYSYLARNRIVNTLYARFEMEGACLTVKKEIPSEYGEIKKYFAVNISLFGLRPGASYVVSNDISINVKLSDGTVVSNPSSIKANDNGEVQTIIYLRSGDKSVLSNLPVDTEYTIVENDYSTEGYRTEGNVTEKTKLESDTVVTITNIPEVRRLTVKKLGRDSPNDTVTAICLEGAGFTLYSDVECNNVAFVQQMTATNGETTFEGLKCNTTYYMKETWTPSGYGGNGKVYKLSVKADGIYQITDDGEEKLAVGTGNSSVITVYNYTQLTLPSAGYQMKTPIKKLVIGIMSVFFVIMIFIGVYLEKNKRGDIK